MNNTQERQYSNAVILQLKRFFQAFKKNKIIVEFELLHYQNTFPNRPPEVLTQIEKVDK